MDWNIDWLNVLAYVLGYTTGTLIFGAVVFGIPSLIKYVRTKIANRKELKKRKEFLKALDKSFSWWKQDSEKREV